MIPLLGWRTTLFILRRELDAMRNCCVALLLLGMCAVLRADAPENKKDKVPEDPRHEELRAMRRGLADALAKNDMDKVLTYLDDDVMVTFMDARVAEKPKGVRDYYDMMLKGDKAIVKKYVPDIEADVLTHLYGDTGVVRGHSNDTFDLADGRQFKILMRWTATVVKKDNKWKIAGLHTSADAFDNPIMDIAIKRTAYWVGAGAGIVGLLLGLVLASVFKRRKT